VLYWGEIDCDKSEFTSMDQGTSYIKINDKKYTFTFFEFLNALKSNFKLEWVQKWGRIIQNNYVG
jgi:hypothetical protein